MSRALKGDMPTITRREALRLGTGVALGLGVSPLLHGCGGETSRPPESPSRPLAPGVCDAGIEEPPAVVGAARGTDLAVMTREVLGLLGGLESVVHDGESVFIKPNMVSLPWATRSWSPFQAGECTKIEILVALAEECLRVGASEVIIGDGSQAPRFDWGLAATLDGSTNLAREADRLSARYGRLVRLACLDVDTPRWVEVPTGISLGMVAVSSLVLDADRVISVAVAKTHRWAHLTLALKNFIGITPLERYGWQSRGNDDRVFLHQNDMGPASFGRLYIDLARAAAPDLALIDFSIGLEGNGPTSGSGGTPVDMRSRLGSWLLLGSRSATAADATAARVMSHEAAYVGEILPMARADGMGAICEPFIELRGAQLADLRVPWQPASIVYAGSPHDVL
jgi:uncharacterized protein (DUF362 family)